VRKVHSLAGLARRGRLCRAFDGGGPRGRDRHADAAGACHHAGRFGRAQSRADALGHGLAQCARSHERFETLDTLPTFRDAFAHRRGLIALSTFNEAKEITPTKREQQVITPRDGQPLAVAVVWERWTHHNEGELLTFAMVTVEANRLISSVTDRMPAFLAPEDWSQWLGEEPASPEELKALLKTVEADWDMRPQTKTPPPPKPKAQSELF
jgi:putative SOS response-associated peptidase YedK